jgi:signal transduction histidine kinase
MIAHEEPNGTLISLANVPPTARQRRGAYAVVALMLVLYGVGALFAHVKFPDTNVVREIVLTLIFTTDFLTAILLFNQSFTNQSGAVLVLANAYLFSSLTMIPYLLTFPGIFSTEPILGTGIQGSPVIYNWWHFVFLSLVAGYSSLRVKPLRSVRFALPVSILMTIVLVCAPVVTIAAYSNDLPRFLLADGTFAPLARYASGCILLIGVIALIMLWLHSKSVLDQWVMVVICAIVLELSILTFFVLERDSLAVTFIRLYLAIAATTVLSIFTLESGRLHAAISRTAQMLQRERNNKLLNIEAVTASIAHEINQPLAAIVANAEATLELLERSPPDLEEARLAQNDIRDAGIHASGIIKQIRDLLTTPELKSTDAIDVNTLVLEVLDIVHAVLKEHGVVLRTEMIPKLPRVIGHKGQLQEVILNLVWNAVEAMDNNDATKRVLTVRTRLNNGGTINVDVQDTGSGIGPDKLEKIFDVFETTKPHGVGLGLAICRMIISHHGGHLSASSENRNGALFQVTLPTRKPLASAPGPV